MATALSNSSQKLMQEIYDQFLICKICYETYKKPKTLICLHIFCTECMEKQLDAEVERSYRYMLYSRTLTCPVCRKKTELPSGGIRKLPDNFLISNLIDIVSRKRGTGKVPLCEICKPSHYTSGKKAVSKCLECSKMLCTNCIDQHRRTYVTKNHSLVDTETEKSISCKIHIDEIVRFYCEPCEMCICILCTFQEHKGHDVQSFSEGLKNHHSSLDNLVTACRDRITCVKDHLEMIRSCENEIRKAEDHIRDTTIESISAIRKNEKQMVEQLYDSYGEDTLQFLKEKNVLQDILDNLSSSCSLTEIILKDKSIELLLLRREIQDKLQNLLHQGQVLPPPGNIVKQIKVQPGYVALGHIAVSGTSDESKPQKIYGNYSDADVQTDALDEPEVTESDTNKGTKEKTENVPSGKSEGRNEYEMKNKQSEENKENIPKRKSKKGTENVQSNEGEDISKNISRKEAMCEAPLASVENGYISDSGSECKSCCLGKISLPDRRKPPDTDDRSINTCHLQTTPTMTESIRLQKSSAQTESIPLVETGVSTTDTDVWSQWTNTPSVNRVDRSTLTTMTNTNDRQTETNGLVDLITTISGPEIPFLQNTGTLTDLPNVRSKFTNTVAKQQSHKKTSTTRNIMLEKFTLTDKLQTYDFGIMARIPGCDKNIGTVTTVYDNTAVGNDNVILQTVDCATDAIWPGIRRVRHKGTLTMDDMLYSTQQTDTDSLINYMDRGSSPFTLENVTHPPKRKLSLESQVSKRVCIPDVQIPNVIQINSQVQTDIGLNEIEAFIRHEFKSKPSEDKSTSMGSCVKVTDVSSGTVEVRRLGRLLNSRSHSFDDSNVISNVRMRDKSTSTYLQTSDQATYMIQPVILSTGTSTQAPVGLDQCVETHIDTKDTCTSPYLKGYHEQFSFKDGMPQRDGVASVGHSHGPKRQLPQKMRETDQAIRDSGINATPSKGQDATTNTLAVDKTDKQTNYEPIPTTNTATMTFVLTSDVGVLKRPHAVSRSTSMKKVKMVENETHMDLPKHAEKSSMTEKAITAPRVRHAMTATTVVTLSDAGTSTPISKTVDRQSSPYRTRTYERHTSPIRQVSHHKGISTNLKSPTAEKSTATFKLQLKNTSTGMPIVDFKDQASSPIVAPGLDKSTSVDKVSQASTGTSTEKIGQVNALTTTGHFVDTKDKGTVPVKFPGHHKATAAVVPTSTKESATVPVRTANKASATSPPAVVETGTGMAHVNYYEKETCTPRINLMHKNVATENISMVDKQTATFDISAAYRGLISPSGGNPVTVSRGTCTTGQGKSFMVDRETSPIKCLPFLVEKATDPIRKVYVNKGVSVTQADLTCPVDKFQRAGQGRPRILPKNMPKEEPDPKFLPSMTTIQEQSSDEECSSPLARHKIFGKIPHSLSESDVSKLTHKERLRATRLRFGELPPVIIKQPAMKNRCDQSTFSTNGSTQTTAIICKVETGTSTPPVETEDKAMCTESLSVDGKINACISKLRTVSKRLEAQTTSYINAEELMTGPIYSKADSAKKEVLVTPATSAPVVSGVKASREAGEGLAPLPTIGKRTRRYGTSNPADTPPGVGGGELIGRRELHSIDTGMASGSSDNGNGNGNGKSKARKQRLDIAQLLHRPPGSPGAGVLPPGATSSRLPHRPSMLGVPKLNILDETARNMDPVHRRLQAKMSAMESPEEEKPPPCIVKEERQPPPKFSNHSLSHRQINENPKVDHLTQASKSPTSSPKIVRKVISKVQGQSPRIKRRELGKEQRELVKEQQPRSQTKPDRRESGYSDHHHQGVCCGLAGSPRCPHSSTSGALSPRVPRKKRESPVGRLPPKRPSSASSTSSASTEEGSDSPVRGSEVRRRRTKKSP